MFVPWKGRKRRKETPPPKKSFFWILVLMRIKRKFKKSPSTRKSVAAETPLTPFHGDSVLTLGPTKELPDVAGGGEGVSGKAWRDAQFGPPPSRLSESTLHSRGQLNPWRKLPVQKEGAKGLLRIYPQPAGPSQSP